MKRAKWFPFLMGLLVGAGVPAVYVAASAPATGQQARPKPPTGTVAVLEAARRLRAEREVVLKDLAAVLSAQDSSELSKGQLLEALKLTGDLHMSDPGVVTAVSQHLYLCRVEMSVLHAETWQLFPGFEALAKIGLPTVPVLVQEIRRDDSEEHRHLAAVFLGEMMGQHAESWLSEAVEQERDEPTKARLQQALRQGTYHGSGAYDSHFWFFRRLDKAWVRPEPEG